MAASVEIDWVDPVAANGAVVVSWQSGAQPTKHREFATRIEGEAFADKRMGARGMIIFNLDMTPEQRVKQAERKARMDAMLARYAAPMMSDRAERAHERRQLGGIA